MAAGRIGARPVAANAIKVDLFATDDPAAIAATLKRAAEQSRVRRGTPFRSAMSVLTVHLNRAGSALDPKRRRLLEAAKDELRKLFDAS